MKPRPRFRVVIGLAITFACVVVRAAQARDVPPAPATFVYDEAGWLSPSDEASLSAELVDFERETSNQIVIAIFHELGNEDLADFSQRIAEAWGIGRAARNNGILLAIFAQDRLIDIEVGYGLEPVVTDAIAEQIRREILVPALRRGDLEPGIRTTVQALMDASRGEFVGDDTAASDRSDRGILWKLFVLFFLFVLVAFVVDRLRRGMDDTLVLGPPSFGRRGRSFSGWRGGSGSFGGSRGGGGFRGGGGSFGGGGARGGW